MCATTYEHLIIRDSTFTVAKSFLNVGLNLPLKVSSGSKGGVGTLACIHLVACSSSTLICRLVQDCLWLQHHNTDVQLACRSYAAWVREPDPYVQY